MRQPSPQLSHSLRLPPLLVVLTSLLFTILLLVLWGVTPLPVHAQSENTLSVVSEPGIPWLDSYGNSGSAVLTYGHIGCPAVDANGFCPGGFWGITGGIDNAHWIWKSQMVTEDEALNGTLPVTFTQTFTLPANATSATGSLRITGDDAYRLYFNGPLVGGDGGMAVTDVDDSWTTIETYAIAPMPGPNVISVVVAGHTHPGGPYGNPSGLLYRADVTYFEPPANSIAVNTVTDEVNNDGDCSLREAIIAANLDAQVDACPAGSGADTIFVPEGIYVLTLPSTHEDGTLDGDLDINSDMTIIGAGASRTIVDGNNAAVPFGLSIGGGRFVALSDMTVRNGNATMEGGNGGGIWAGGTEGYLTLTNMAIVDNFAPGAQGGIAAGRRMTITNSLIANNRTNGTGGGFDSAGAVMLLINTTVSGNHAGQGGGIANSGQITLINSTIAGNHVDQDGGGIFNAEGTVTLLNTIVAGNTNAANDSRDCAGTMTLQGYNLIGDTRGCTIIGGTTGNLTGMDPLLGPLQDNGGETLTHALLTSSPAIDAGSPAVPGSGGNACAATDQRGVLRPLDGDGDTQTPLRCDIGAFEFCRHGFTQSCFTPGSPPPPSSSSPLHLSFFTSESVAGSVTLQWETEAEAGNLGFNLYRIASNDGTATKVNAELIPAQGNAKTGAAYQFVDRPASGEYVYLIKNVDQQGVEHQRGQVEVAAEGSVLFVPALSAP